MEHRLAHLLRRHRPERLNDEGASRHFESFGRSDLEVEGARRRWVFAFKFARKSDKPDKLLEKALEQLQARRHGICAPRRPRLLRSAKTVRRLAGASRALTAPDPPPSLSPSLQPGPRGERSERPEDNPQLPS